MTIVDVIFRIYFDGLHYLIQVYSGVIQNRDIIRNKIILFM